MLSTGSSKGRQAMNSGRSSTSSETRDESYMLLLELITQEPTVQNCFKIIESTCLAQGVDVSMDGNPPTKEFKRFIDLHYTPFCENAIRCFFACGFVPWRLRKLATGDPVPEVIPFGLYSWTVENHTNRPARTRAGGDVRQGVGKKGDEAGGGGGKLVRKSGGQLQNASRELVDTEAVRQREKDRQPDQYTRMAKVHFQKQAEYFQNSSVQPYQLQGDLGTMKGGDAEKLKRKREEADSSNGSALAKKARGPGTAEAAISPGKIQSASYLRQKRAMDRQSDYYGDDDSKLLHYKIHFNRSCRIIEDEVEIYEYIQPSMDVTTNSVLYQTVPSPMSHVLIDYRNLRQAMIRKEYADCWNLQGKMVCSYTSQKNIYQVSEGNPISNNWNPQNRMGVSDDYNLPMEMDQNAYTRDAITETIANAKEQVHKPVVYTLPKNSKLESVPHLDSIQDTSQMEVKLAKDIASICGIPYEIIGGGYGDKQGAKKSLENSRIFTTNMVNICHHLEKLLRDVYAASFGSADNDVRFTLRATPRIEINSVQDVCMLLEAGVVSFNNAMTISNMLLGVDLQQGSGQKADAGQFSRAFITPTHKKDLIVASSAKEKAKQVPSSSSSKK